MRRVRYAGQFSSCKQQDKTQCGIVFSTGQQSRFCAISQTASWPAFLQVSRLQQRCWISTIRLHSLFQALQSNFLDDLTIGILCNIETYFISSLLISATDEGRKSKYSLQSLKRVSSNEHVLKGNVILRRRTRCHSAKLSF
jgi:hypothetical protein